MWVNPAVASAYYAQVPGSVYSDIWTVPCSAQLPGLTLNIGSGSAVISGDKFQSRNPTIHDSSREFLSFP